MADLLEMAKALGKELQKDERYLAFRKAAEDAAKLDDTYADVTYRIGSELKHIRLSGRTGRHLGTDDVV